VISSTHAVSWRRVRTSNFENTVVIRRPIEEVFAFPSHFENVPSRNYAIIETRKVSEGPVGVGTIYQGESPCHVSGRPWPPSLDDASIQADRARTRFTPAVRSCF
jgi:hypothetical protein